ncbi:MAG: glycosyltransferase family 1 protein [Patescibacteria group bacterium]|jgi:glycosyltransferase involved in cell wall biosynthesis
MIIGIDASSITTEHKTGVENASYQLILHMAKLNHQHELILYSPRPIESKMSDLKNVTVLLSSPARLWHTLRLPIELIRTKPDVFFTPSYMVPRLSRIKSVALIHDLAFVHYPHAYSRTERKLQHYAAQRNAKYASALVFVSESTKRDFVNQYRCRTNNLSVIHLGYDSGRYNSDEKPSLAGLPKPYLLYVGRLEERKNIRRIIESFILFKKKSSSSHRLVLAGKPGYGSDAILTLLKDYDKHKNDIIFTGYVRDDQLPGLYSNADALLFPTLYEGFGLPLLESFASGTPVITSNTSSLPEVAGDAALLVDPEKTSEIANAIDIITSDKLLAEKLQKKGIERAKLFSWERSAKKLLGILEGIK